MVNTMIGVNQGLRDWIIQRLSAVYLAFFSLFFLGFIICHPGMTFTIWHDLFAHQAMKVFTVLFFLAVMWHAWIGVWTIFTDYVKPFVIRSILNCLVLLILFASFVWGALVLWSL